MKNSCTCEICTVNNHRASYAKRLRSKKHLENEKQNQMIISEWLIKEEQARFKTKIKKYLTLKH